ncbi:hypothetical protein PIB30_089234 [Stylosanthes scabra]|uniref:Uncharacterized protein n=1 Tax=Stylosanthes scabra TaxID=79078 RepID=A0ABU6UTE4_9FABA|nr:hypothetical protein [Stylosanthes scabra]
MFARTGKFDSDEFGLAWKKGDYEAILSFVYSWKTSVPVLLAPTMLNLGEGGFNINEGAQMPSNHRASSPSPSFSPYVNRTVHAPPPDVPHFEEHDGGFMMHSPEIGDPHAEGVNSDNGEDEEFIPETQPPVVKPNLAIASIAAPLRHVREEAAHYSTINPEGMQSGSMEDGPSSYPVSGELELEVGLKFNNREIAMLAVKNYNIRRSAEFKVIESDRSK